jgi:hypothetical protein
VLGQAEALATLPGTQDYRFNQACREVATIKKQLPCFKQLLAMYVGSQLNSPHFPLQCPNVFFMCICFIT